MAIGPPVDLQWL